MTTAVQQFSQASKSAAIRQFTSQVTQMQDQLARSTAAERVSQFGFTALEVGEYVMAYDSLGQARLRLGWQTDGTVAVVYVNGDPPPVPSPPVVSARQLGVYVAWDGGFVEDRKAPGDFLRVDVHMSETAGFTPDGTTIVGTMPDAGGILVGADNVTHYVKIVAVSHSKDMATGTYVASAPTAEVAVLPLPATQIAAGAIGAQQLAADIALLSRLIVGNQDGARLEMDARVGTSPGMRLYDSVGNVTVSLDATTGDFYARGTFSTGESGERLYIDDNEIRFYPSSGSNCARLIATSNVFGDSNFGNLVLEGPLYQDDRARLTLNYAGAVLSYGSGDDDADRARVGATFLSSYLAKGSTALNAYATSLSGSAGNASMQVAPGEVNMLNSYGFVAISSGNARLKHSTSTRLMTDTATLQFAVNGGGYPFVWVLANSALQMASNSITCYNPNGGALVSIVASNVQTSSGRATKTAIEDVPFDPLAAVRANPAQMWERKRETKDRRGRRRKNIGPMADDMPAELQVTHHIDGREELGIDMGSQLGVLWAAVDQLAGRLEEMEAA